MGVNNRSNVYTTWSDKRPNACPTMVKCVASNDIHASNPHLIPTSPPGGGGGGGGGGVSRNNDRCITLVQKELALRVHMRIEKKVTCSNL